MSQANQTKGIDRVMAIMVRIMEVCSLIGIFSIGAIMVITTLDVLGRYLFNAPVPATYELTECAVAGAVFLGIAYTQFRKGHVQMEIVVLHLSQRGKAITNILYLLLSLGLLVVISWQTAGAAYVSWQGKELHSGVYAIPIWPVKAIVPFGCLLLCFQFLFDLVNLFRKLFPRRKG